MRKLCPNFDKEDGLETVLEVPIPEEMFGPATGGGSNNVNPRWQMMRSWLKTGDKSSSRNEFMSLLKLVGSSLVPFQIRLEDQALSRPIQVASIEASTAKYIVQQYVAATGGTGAFEGVSSMCAVGQMKMVMSDMRGGNESLHVRGNSEVGGFVLWQKNPDLWCLELVVSGFKVSAGSDGKVAWNQSSSQASYANSGPPRPLRRFFQGLDPRMTANLFLQAVCIGEKNINNEDCFILKLETGASALKAQSTAHTDIVHHTLWGYFSQRTGLLVQFEDTKLVRMTGVRGNDSVFWETTMVTTVGDYRYVDGINIAHAGTTSTMLYRYGSAGNAKKKIEEKWKMEEVDFNICGLSLDCFLPPSDLKREQEDGKER